MNLVFTKGKKTFEIPVSGDAEVKLYTVSAAYSSDGHYLAGWGAGEVEPVPACEQADTELLAHVAACLQGDGTYVLRELFRAKGVTYAQN